MHYDKKHGAIHKSIEVLDRMGMDIIETGDPDSFKQYLSETDNTICGRHPISVFLHVIVVFPINIISKTHREILCTLFACNINNCVLIDAICVICFRC